MATALGRSVESRVGAGALAGAPAVLSVALGVGPGACSFRSLPRGSEELSSWRMTAVERRKVVLSRDDP